MPKSLTFITQLLMLLIRMFKMYKTNENIVEFELFMRKGNSWSKLWIFVTVELILSKYNLFITVQTCLIFRYPITVKWENIIYFTDIGWCVRKLQVDNYLIIMYGPPSLKNQKNILLIYSACIIYNYWSNILNWLM